MSEPQIQTQIQTPGASEAPEPKPHIRGINGETLVEQISRVLEELKRGGLLVVKIKKAELLKALPRMNSRPWYQWAMLRKKIEEVKSSELNDGCLYVWIGYSNGRWPIDTMGWPYYYIAVSTQYKHGRLNEMALILIDPYNVSWIARAVQQEMSMRAIRRAIPREDNEPLDALAQALYTVSDNYYNAIGKLIDLVLRLINIEGDGINLRFLLERLIKAGAYARYIKSGRLPPVSL